MRVICVAGARPNFMKIKPVVDALEDRGVDVVLVHTGQHYDPAMSQVFFEDLGLRLPDLSLEVGSGSHGSQTAEVMRTFEPVVERCKPDVVVVVGDVNSTVAAALVTAKSPAKLAHVEAGLRSRDWSMPEEINRVVTDRVSDFLFASEPEGAANLRAEGYPHERIHLAGNVMIDTLLTNLDRARRRDVPRRFGLSAGQYGVVTLHRPANVDHPQILADLLATLATISRECPLVLPVHPRAKQAIEASSLPHTIITTEPLGYLDFLGLQEGARVVLTDSGGVQEETTALGIPCLTLRDNTERPVTVSEGTNQVVGRDPQRILAAARCVFDNGVHRRRPALWDGCAGQRIAQVICPS